MNKPLKYFIYIRKSTEGKDRQALSHEGQLMEIRKLVEREKLFVVDTFFESKSAHIPDNRPLFNQMLKRITKNEAQGIIAWHTNRLSRNPKESGIVQQMLQDQKIKSIIVPYRQFKSEDNALLFSIETSEANQYSRDLKLAVTRGLKQKYIMGQPPGMAPLGYLNTKSAVRGSNKIIVDEQRWPIVRKGFDLILTQTHTVPQILTILTTHYGLDTRPANVRGGKLLSRSGLYRIFTNPFYCGLFYRNGILYKGAYKAMLTIEEYDQIQIILGRKGKPRAKHRNFTYTGLIKCGVCDSAITAIYKTKKLHSGGFKSYIYYYCTHQKKGGEMCSERHYITSVKLENMIVDELSKYEITASFRDLSITILKENYQGIIEKQNSLINAQQGREKRLLQELSNLVDLRISNGISEEMYFEKKIEKDKQLFDLQQRKDQLISQPNDWIRLIEKQINFSASVVSRFKNGDDAAKKEICHEFGLNWTLRNQNLFIDKPEWLETIKRCRDHVETKLAELGKLEPYEIIENKDYNTLMGMMSPFLCALVDEVRTMDNRMLDNTPSN